MQIKGIHQRLVCVRSVVFGPCKLVCTNKGCIFAQEFNILESPKYVPSLISERERAPFTSAEELCKSGAENGAEQ